LKLANLPSKWATELRPAMPLGQAAQLVLSVRLGAVPRLLELATQSSAVDTETVHQLRVWTRRADAALILFSDCCPETVARRLRRRLRRIRQGAARLRAIDVQLATLEALATSEDEAIRADAAALMKCLRKQRRRADQRMRKLPVNCRPDDLRATTTRLLTGVSVLSGEAGEPRVVATLLDSARSRLPRLLGKLRRATQRDLSAIRNVHRVRLASKQLRYAMEICAPCLAPEFKGKHYQGVAALQERLGAINDADDLAITAHAAAEERGDAIGRPSGDSPEANVAAPSSRALAAHLASERDRLQRAFVGWWSSEGDREVLKPLAGLLDGLPVASSRKRNEVLPAAAVSAGRDSSGSLETRVVERVRVAAIDVGTNSIRLVVAESDPRSRFRIIEDLKDTTRLGAGLYFTGRLALDSVRKSIRALQRMKSVAQQHHVSRIRAVATAAVREASNGAAFAELVKRRVGLPLEIVDAEEEARLAHSSVANAFDLDGQRMAVVDIGGGSTEVVFSADGLVDSIAKLPLGAVHLTEAYGVAGSDGELRYDEMVAAIDSVMGSVLPDWRDDPAFIVGTGGTFTTLAKVSLRRGLVGNQDGRLPFDLRGYQMSRAEICEMLDWLRAMPLNQRRAVPGLSSRRAEIVVAGMTIIARLVHFLRVERVCVHDGGIRDGLLTRMLDEVGAHPLGRPPATDTVRCVRAFARQCSYEQEHAEHVARLAMQIFDQLVAMTPEAGSPWARAENRALLHAAAILHDIGHVIGYRRHHKHAYDLIVKAALPVFTRRELEIVANVARYHRRAAPARQHKGFARLSADDQRLVGHLAGILRIADGLDCTHMQNVQAVRLTVMPRRVRFVVRAEQEPSINLRDARRNRLMFERGFGRSVDFQWGKSQDSKSGDAEVLKRP
jgi:exopolyphosphatase/guanosine-5'-triphosphate,3'-diphosphate pyrophosphatase